MSEDPTPAPFRDLDERLRAARRRHDEERRPQGRGDAASGMGLGLRVGVELVSAVVIGVGIGYGLDRWLGTRPWLLVVFMILGFVAGILNVVRLSDGSRKSGGGDGAAPG